MKMDILKKIKGKRISLIEKFKKCERALSLIEIMVSVAIMGAVMAGATRLFINSMSTQAANRDLTIIESEVQDIFNGYRQMNYLNLLSQIGGSVNDIQNGQSIELNVAGAESNANYTVQLTVVKTKEESFPESIIIRVNVNQQTSADSNADFNYETIISQIS